MTVTSSNVSGVPSVELPTAVRFPSASFLYTNRSQSFWSMSHSTFTFIAPLPSFGPIENSYVS